MDTFQRVTSLFPVCFQVAFFPSTTEKFRQDFTIVCDNCQVKHLTVRGKKKEVIPKEL